ncbi:MAG: phage terminase large subunit [Verrucomicrobiales bacterium]|jgi:hypothetical protein|nr:phage terminase large subunit [Verrucomicrobiales bacterium]
MSTPFQNQKNSTSPRLGGENESWYQPGPKIAEAHHSAAFARFLIGARGCGKTTFDAVEAIDHGWHHAGSKILVLRKTEESQAATAIETFNATYTKCGDLYQDSELGLFKKWEDGKEARLPSRAAVEAWQEFLKSNPTKTQKKLWLQTEGHRLCSWVLFRGLNHPQIAGNKLRSFECSMIIFVEADQLTRDNFDMALMCLRLKDAHGREHPDYCAIVDTNPPDPDHWIAKLEQATADGEFPKYRFWHIPMTDNAHNLPANYVANAIATYQHNPAMYRRMIEGEYEYVYNGSPVYWGFRVGEHAAEALPWPRGAYLVVGWDFGTNNANVFSAYFASDETEYWWDLLELTASGSDTETQCRAVLAQLDGYFAFCQDRNVCAGVLHFCDPAGAANKSTGSDLKVLKSYGLHPGYRTAERGLATTLAIGNRLLEMRDQRGAPVYRVARAGCPTLVAGLCGKYRYPEKGEPGYGNGQPLKGPAGDDIDHVMDAWRYAKINCLRLANEEHGQAPMVGVLAGGSGFRNRRKRR